MIHKKLKHFKGSDVSIYMARRDDEMVEKYNYLDKLLYEISTVCARVLLWPIMVREEYGNSYL